MTRENAKNIAEAISFKIKDGQRLSLVGVNELIDQIFNDHEAQLKQRDEEIERLRVELIEARKFISTLDYIGSNSK